MTTRALSTKERLIRSASDLFRKRGYSGVGVAEILVAAKAPKGSLYHHFPNGKSDLAMAAATWAADGTLQLIAASFEDATSFRDGATTFCYKLAKLFDISGNWDGCPIQTVLSDGPDNTEFSTALDRFYDGWIAEIAMYAERFGAPPERAREMAENFFMLFQGAWTLARARRDSDVLRRVVIPD